MYQNSRKYLLALSILSLTACSPSPNFHQLQREIETLSQQMSTLSQIAKLLHEQNALNAHSNQGAYLLPNAESPVLLNSQVGTLKISLSSLISSPSGTQAILLFEETNQQPLPVFSGNITWTTLEDKNGETITDQRTFTTSASQSMHQYVYFSWILPIAPERVKWIRVNNLHPELEKPPLTSG